MSLKFRNICFTINNPTDTDILLIKKGVDDGIIRYAYGAHEKGELCGTPHIQGYAQFKDELRQKATKALFPRANFRKAKGSPQENLDYCQKGEMKKRDYKEYKKLGTRALRAGPNYGLNFKLAFEYGTPKIQGKRVDLENIQKTLMNGVPLHEVIWKCKNSQQQKYAENLYRCPQVPKPHRNWRTEAHVYHGGPNTGKTYKAREQAEKYAKANGYAIWYSGENGKWFSGYNGQEVVVLEDWDDSQYTLGVMLRLIDDTPYRVNPKFAPEEEWLARRIYFSTNFAPEEWYPNCPEKRRIALVGDEYGRNGRITVSRHFTTQRKEGRPTTKFLNEDDSYEEDNLVDKNDDSEESTEIEESIKMNDISEEISFSDEDSKSVSEVGRVILEPAETQNLDFDWRQKVEKIKKPSGINLSKKENDKFLDELFVHVPMCRTGMCINKKNEFSINCDVHCEECVCGDKKVAICRHHDEKLNEINIYPEYCNKCYSNMDENGLLICESNR